KLSKHALLINTIQTLEPDVNRAIKAYLIKKISTYKTTAATLPFFVSVLALVMVVIVGLDFSTVLLFTFGSIIFIILLRLMFTERQRYRILPKLEYLLEMLNQHGPK
ncbi:hypothetical protein, partial [Shouchella clausii]|uniref:hypothetical protein n=1 Tax=Shouchella clausii TaxID=79880 RepID=UPI000BCA2847